METTKSLISEQDDMKQDINNINLYIKSIEAENVKLRTQLYEIQDMMKDSVNRKTNQKD